VKIAVVVIVLEDSANVILGNIAMDEGRRVYMSEIDKMGGGPLTGKEA
jgi:hypothetical protein